jgi:chromosome partitioning protein
MITIAIANQKGGVSKTHTTHALGEALAQLGEQVLLVDVDPQSSLTTACGVLATDHSLAQVLSNDTEIGAVLRPVGEFLTLAPSDIALANTELDLVNRMGRENELIRALKPIANQFDVCLIDTAPSLGLLAVNALNAADGALVPTLPQVQDLRGLGLFLQTLNRIRDRLNPELETVGILVTMFDGRLVHHNDAVTVMLERGLPVMDVKIGRSVKVAEAAAAHASILTYDPAHKISDQYRVLAKEVQLWLESGRA